MSTISAKQIAFIAKLDAERGVSTMTDGMTSQQASKRIAELLATPKAKTPTKTSAPAGEMRYRVYANAQYAVGDIYDTHNIYTGRMRITRVGKTWSENVRVDAEDNLSDHGHREITRGTVEWKYIYGERIA